MGKFSDIDLHPDVVSNVEMGYLYEEVGPVAVHHDRLDSGPDLIVHAGEALEDRAFATSFGEVDDASALGVGQHGVKVKALLEGAHVEAQHARWGDRAGEEFVEDVVLEGLADPVVRHRLEPGDVGGGLIARRLEQSAPEAVGYGAPAGDLGVTFTTGALAIAAGKPAWAHNSTTGWPHARSRIRRVLAACVTTSSDPQW
jgi:hypothetical protein